MSQNAEKLHQDRFGAHAITMLGGERKNNHNMHNESPANKRAVVSQNVTIISKTDEIQWEPKCNVRLHPFPQLPRTNPPIKL